MLQKSVFLLTRNCFSLSSLHSMTAPTRVPAGYTALMERFGLEAIPNWHRSFVSSATTHRLESDTEGIEETYISRYWPGDAAGDHLEFALKYDGTNLGILAELFEKIPVEELLSHIRSKPTGKYARRIWFLYEFLTGRRLALADLTTGNYVDLLDPDDYYTVSSVQQVRRQRINNNLLGDARLCPVIRRTDALRAYEAVDLAGRCQRVVASYTSEQLKRALSYLYTKETKSSFEIEHIKPSATRIERFVALLHLAERDDFCEKNRLIDLQNQIVDPRFRESDYRTVQNYVGEAVAWREERVHYACPKPNDLPELMEGLIATNHRMNAGRVSAVIQATVIAYQFVFLHPFEDGNGRIHRFLIHNVLAHRGFTPKGVLFPVSAVMLKYPLEYDASLEAFSRPLMKLVEYSLDEQGQMTVQSDTAKWYRYLDLTRQAEMLFKFIEQTIETELVAELSFLAKYDAAKRAIQAVVDMPDRQIDLLIRFCLQNQGRLSQSKRASHFGFLSDEEIQRIEQACHAAYQGDDT
jgi:hypothetical protein